LLRFIEFAELGKLERAYRTQSKVQTHDGPILNLVSAQFQEQVVESGKDVLVLFWSDESRERYLIILIPARITN
jgi:thioredoxin-like negative regulator of GroEL